MDIETAFAQLAARCQTTELCLSDARVRLRRMGLTDEECTHILARLTEELYIDERRYARAFVNDKFRLSRWGRVKIRQALRLKGIAAAHIEEALQTIDDETYRHTLRTLLVVKRRTLTARTPRELKTKLIRFAVGRGFEVSLVCQMLGYDEGETDNSYFIQE